MKRVPHITILTISTTSCIFSFSFLEMEWSNEQTLLFIEQYEKMPVLWDSKRPEHKNRVKLNDAWVELQKKFDNSIPIVELKKKKESLMASYRSLRKEVLESEGTGSSTDDIFKPSWYAFEAIDRFMRAKGEKSPTVNSEVSISYLIQLLFTSANQL